MTLPVFGPPTYAPGSGSQIGGEFGLSGALKASDFYGKGGAASSGPLNFRDFSARSGVQAISSTGDVYLSGFNKSGSSTITAAGGRTITAIALVAGSASARINPGSTGRNSATGTITTPASGVGSISATYRYTCSTGEFISVTYAADWDAGGGA